MAELGVKIVKLPDGTILRMEPGTDTGDLEVISEGVEEEPKVVKTSPDREVAEPAKAKPVKQAESKTAKK
jgi:hypothetical protein